MIPDVGSPFIPIAQGSQSSANQAAAPQEEVLSEEERALQNLQQAVQEQSEAGSSPFDNELTEEEERIVEDLKQTDREVRAHEQAHKTIAGPYAGAISYETVTGPDGRQYAVAGSVDIDISPVPNNPEATIRKMDIVIRAALAPAEPSPQDQAVARQAQQTRAVAQRELQEQREAEREESGAQETSPLEIQPFDPNAEIENASNPQIQQISTLIQRLNEASALTENTSGTLFDAIN